MTQGEKQNKSVKERRNIGQIKKNKRTYWVSLGRLKKGLDSHRRKVVLCMEQKSSFITSIQSEEDSPGGRPILYKSTIQRSLAKERAQGSTQSSNE